MATKTAALTEEQLQKKAKADAVKALVAKTVAENFPEFAPKEKPEKPEPPKIKADETLKRKIDRYRRFNQVLKLIADRMEPLKKEFNDLGECVIVFEDRKIASQQTVSKDGYFVLPQENLTFRTH